MKKKEILKKRVQCKTDSDNVVRDHIYTKVPSLTNIIKLKYFSKHSDCELTFTLSHYIQYT